jgi:outer membrane protein TolC
VAPTLSLNYLLLDFGGRAARVEAARQALEAANWTHAATLQSVLFAAIQAYYQMFAAHASLQAADATEKSTQKAFDAAAYRYEIGSAALSDKLQAQTTHAQAKVNRRTAAGNAQSSLGPLAAVMGLKPQSSLQFEPPSLTGPNVDREKDVQELIDLAKTSRPDLAAAEAQVKATEAGILQARSGSMPTLSLVGNYTYLETLGVSNISSWAIGVQVAVPIFTGFNNTYQIKSAEEQVEMQAANRDKLEQSIAQEVWRAYYTLAATRENLQNTQELLDSAVQAEKVALGRYEEGVGNIVELMNAEANLANARYQFVQAHYNWRIGKAQLAQALGRLDMDDVAAVDGPGERRITN